MRRYVTRDAAQTVRTAIGADDSVSLAVSFAHVRAALIDRGAACLPRDYCKAAPSARSPAERPKFLTTEAEGLFGRKFRDFPPNGHVCTGWGHSGAFKKQPGPFVRGRVPAPVLLCENTPSAHSRSQVYTAATGPPAGGLLELKSGSRSNRAAFSFFLFFFMEFGVSGYLAM